MAAFSARSLLVLKSQVRMFSGAMRRYLPVNKTIPPLYGNSEEFPENAILEKGIPEEFPSIPDLGNSRFGNSPPLLRAALNFFLKMSDSRAKKSKVNAPHLTATRSQRYLFSGACCNEREDNRHSRLSSYWESC